MFKRFGKFISSMKVVNLHQKNNECGNCDDDIDSMLINFEKSNEIRFPTLSEGPRQEFFNHSNFYKKNNSFFQNNSITVSTTKNSDGTIINSPVSKLTSIKDQRHRTIGKGRVNRTQPLWSWHLIHFSCMDSNSSIKIIYAFSWSILGRCKISLEQHGIWSHNFFLLHFCWKAACLFWIFIPNQKRFCFRCFFSCNSNYWFHLKFKKELN